MVDVFCGNNFNNKLVIKCSLIKHSDSYKILTATFKEQLFGKEFQKHRQIRIYDIW